MDNGATNVSAADALQREMARRVLVRRLEREPRTVAALDAAYQEDVIHAAAALFTLDPLRLVEERVVVQECAVPYQPGYFFSREAPALLAALSALSAPPDLLLIEGHGIAHPRRCGIACHIGVTVGIPSIGCAKTRLVGTYVAPGPEKGDWSTLSDGEAVGAVVRTRSGVKPLFVSVGHLITLEEAVDLVLRCCGEYRIPGPLRAADMAARKGVRELLH
ncbi:endonuclease V [Geomonas sp. RF6]|uniref:endonuclease V n=1 Tax=Geomonas sp. RF6 TaxID=2897342 RepID=UPI001E4B5AB8|nr:endonuclease V [Geomonas sp. RF6]UFS70303.1 endonuclease V [Geomonas sp. RF6]